MRAGALDQTIVIQRSTASISDAGTPTLWWTDMATVRAALMQNATTETVGSKGATDETEVIFRTRYLAGVTNAHRISHGGRLLNIKEVRPIGRKRALEIRCAELKGD